jgi:hypothetical protein
MKNMVIEAEKIEINVVKKEPETILYLIFELIKSVFNLFGTIIFFILVYCVLRVLF